MEFKTITGRRPDLESLAVNKPEGYIGGLIFPSLPVMEKTGSIYYKTATADSAAQTGRSSGTAPTRTMVTDSSTTFSCAEVIKRYGVDKAEVKQMGGVEAADRVGGMASKRSVLRAIETAQAAALFSAARFSGASDISSGIVNGIIGGAKSVKRINGKLAFVCSVTTYRYIIQTTEIKALMGRFVPAGLTAEQILSLSPQAFKAMLQGLFLFDEVLIGDDDHWEITGQEGEAAIVKLPPPEPESHKMDPVYAKTALYLPDGSQAFEVESHYDEDSKVNNYDASAWYNIKEFNTAGVKVVKGLVSGS